MSATFESFDSTVPVATAGPVVITKPTGLSVGDFMVAHIGLQGTDDSIPTQSGWDSEVSITNGTHVVRIFSKVADSGDVAASDFSFNLTVGGGNPIAGGALYRITSQGVVTPFEVSASANWSGTSADVDAAITPTRANDLLLMLISYAFATSGSVSGQAIATSNPTWTEDYDIVAGDGTNLMSGSHATRPETTSTGNVSFSSAQSATSGVVVLIGIHSALDVTVTPSALTVASTQEAPAIAGGATVTVSSLTVASVQEDPASARQADWSVQGKNTSSWTNQNK